MFTEPPLITMQKEHDLRPGPLISRIPPTRRRVKALGSLNLNQYNRFSIDFYIPRESVDPSLFFAYLLVGICKTGRDEGG